jgi:potassium-dependent mechanosensitive channel
VTETKLQQNSNRLAGRWLFMRKTSLSRLLLFVLPVLIVIGTVTTAIAEATLPERAAVEERLAKIQPAEGEATSEAVRRESEGLQAVLSGLGQLAQIEERLAALNERVAQAPGKLLSLEHELEVEQEGVFTELDHHPLDELETRQQEAVFELQQLQDRLAEVNAQLLSADTLPERAQRAISEAMQAAEETRRAMDEIEAGQPAENDLRLMQQQVARRLAEQRLRLHQRELETNTRLRELAQQRRELLTVKVERQLIRLGMLLRVIDRQRRLASEQAIAEAALDDPLIASGHPVLERALQINRDLSLELLEANDRSNELIQEGLLVRSQLDRVHQLQRSLNEQIRAIRSSGLLSRILREQRGSLPQVKSRRGLQDEIADLRLRQFDLDRHRDELRQGERLARQRLHEADMEITPALVESLQRIYQSRRELVDQLEQTHGNLLNTAIELELNQQQLLENSRELRATIDKQLFWVASRRPLDLAWLSQLPPLLLLEWQEGVWRRALPVHWQAPRPGAIFGLPLLAAAAALLLFRRRIKTLLAALHEQIGHLHSDSQVHTPTAIALNALLALPGPLVLAGLGLVLVSGGQGVAVGFGKACSHLALAWAVVAWSRRLLAPDGVAVRHFHRPAAYVAGLRRQLQRLGVALAPVLMITIMAQEGEFSLYQRPLALVVLLSGLAAMGILQAKLILAHVPFFGVNLFRLIFGLALATVPLILAGLIVAGYEYTALTLVGQFAVTLYLLGVWILAEATVKRGLAVAARRLAFRRAQARHRVEEQEGAEGGLDMTEEPPLDLQQINQQSLRFTKLMLFLCFTLLFYLVWADLLAVLSYLEQVAIWRTGAGAGTDPASGALSVADIISALLIIFLTMAIARNLPGLLEVTVLSRIELKQGSSYAITSLLSYAIVVTGLVLALAVLGVSWNKLQWLVAALGVGLGFGLQEIFANFVSGLIILFERPVRIGDTITLGDLTGTVSKIDIRATTVIDFDRKEIIIPNKTFVTDQLINWSLSDTVTRVVLAYGVAYGSDHRLVHRLLRQVAEENQRVLGDPGPQVFFMTYGESTLNFEMRVFVKGLGDRLYATDEINCRVGELFAEHKVDIAFNQLDVRLRRSDNDTPEKKSRDSATRGASSDHPPPGSTGDPGELTGQGEET